MLMRATGAKRSDIFGVLDIGTSKTVCLIVAPPKARSGLWRRQSMRVLGFGHAPTRGLKAGVVIDLDRAEQSVRAAVAQAERTAKATAHDMFVAVTCGRIRSNTFEADTRVQGRAVEQRDLDKLMAAARTYVERDGRRLLHINPIGYRLDGTAPVSDPLGTQRSYCRRRSACHHGRRRAARQSAAGGRTLQPHPNRSCTCALRERPCLHHG